MSAIKASLITAASRAGVLRVALGQKRSPPLVLMYHGVTRQPRSEGLRNYEGKHLAVDLFAAHLCTLSRSRRVISLQELIDGLYAGTDLTNTVVITFDDGYQNNALVAAPVLADFKMPATFFLTTGLIGSERFIWPDRVEMALDRTRKERVNLPGNNRDIPLRSLEEKQHALVSIKALLKAQPMATLEHAVEQLADQLGVPDTGADADYRFMDWDQARSLVRSGFDVGAHTVTHPVLTKIPFDAAAKEILDSRDTVTTETGQCSSTFCFPNGKPDDYDPQIQAFCQTHFKAALATNRGAAVFGDIFELKRLSPAGKGKGENIEWALLKGC